MPAAIKFKSVVAGLTRTAQKKAGKKKRKTINTIADTVRMILRQQSWGKPGVGKTKILTKSYGQLREASTSIDAIYCLQEHTSAKGTRWLEFPIPPPRDALDKLQRKVKESLRENGLLGRGFAYVAWSVSPREYLYIGKAKSVDRLNLTTHGKLAHASASAATRLSLIFPAKDRDGVRKAIEASLIAVIKCVKGMLPEYNEQEGRVPEGCGSRDREKLEHFMSSCWTGHTFKDRRAATGQTQHGVSKSQGTKKTRLLEAAVLVLREAGQPMNTQEMVRAIQVKRLWKSTGKTPARTLYSSIRREIQKKGDDARFVKVERGKFTLKA